MNPYLQNGQQNWNRKTKCTSVYYTVLSVFDSSGGNFPHMSLFFSQYANWDWLDICRTSSANHES